MKHADLSQIYICAALNLRFFDFVKHSKWYIVFFDHKYLSTFLSLLTFKSLENRTHPFEVRYCLNPFPTIPGFYVSAV